MMYVKFTSWHGLNKTVTLIEGLSNNVFHIFPSEVIGALAGLLEEAWNVTLAESLAMGAQLK